MKKFNVLFLLFAGLSLAACARREGSQQETSAAAPAADAQASPQLMALFPAGDQVQGWEMSHKARAFKAGDLWKFIDGAADRYLAYGLEEVVSADYVQKGTGYQAVVDIYQLRDPLNAFGIYSQERNPDYQFLKIGNEAWSGSTSLNFWTGRYYVKITAFEARDPLKQEMDRLAAAVAGKVAVRGAEPAEAGWFPKASQIPRSVVYVPKDVLAQSYFTGGFEARYKAGDREYKMVLVILESPEAAQKALARYQQFLSGGGKAVRDLPAPGQGGFSGKAGYYGNLVAVRSGRHIAVALRVLSEDEGMKLTAELIENIR